MTLAERVPRRQYGGPHIPIALRTDLRRRLARVEGQVRGLQRMLEEDRYCEEVLYQIDAARGALREVGRRVLGNHLETCVTRAVLDQDPEIYDEFMDVIKRFHWE